MNVPSFQFLTGAALLSQAMRTIRRQRGMRSSDIAARMGMPLRSYEHFESADATDSDPFALIAALALDSPEFPVRTADNKLMLILMLALRDLNEELGEDIVYLEAKTLIGAFTRVSRELVEHVRKRDTFAETWLSERLGPSRTTIPTKKGGR